MRKYPSQKTTLYNLKNIMMKYWNTIEFQHQKLDMEIEIEMLSLCYHLKVAELELWNRRMIFLGHCPSVSSLPSS